MVIACALKTFRERRKASIEELSRRSVITVARLKRLEGAASVMFVEELFVLANAHGVKPTLLTKPLWDAASLITPIKRANTAW